MVINPDTVKMKLLDKKFIILVVSLSDCKTIKSQSL